MRSVTLLIATALSLPGAALAAGKGAVLHDFRAPQDGSTPEGSLLRDSAGAIYGTTTTKGPGGAGTAYKLTPPAGGTGKWLLTVLHAFTGADGAEPAGGLVADAAGNLYGVTQLGGASNQGVAYELTPPAAGQTGWTQTILHSFGAGNDGVSPRGEMVLDAGGALYGMTYSGGASDAGTVFKLTPPAAGQTQWTELILHEFGAAGDGSNPMAGPILDAAGNLDGAASYGGAGGVGAIFRLSPPAAGQTAWTQTILYSFTAASGPLPDGQTPNGPLILDSAGALYGTTLAGGRFPSSPGIAYKLTPPPAGQASWSETVLYRFGGGGSSPLGSLRLDGTGALYGTAFQGGAFGYGTVFKLTPPAAGQSTWTESVLDSFRGLRDGGDPAAGLIADPTGLLYGTTYLAGGSCHCGTVFAIRP